MELVGTLKAFELPFPSEPQVRPGHFPDVARTNSTGAARERAWNEKPSRGRRLGDRGSEAESREMPGGFGHRSLGSEQVVPGKLRKTHAPWQARRLLIDAAGQLEGFVKNCAPSEQDLLRAALRDIERIAEALAPLAIRPERSRRLRYSPAWRRAFAALLRERREMSGLSRRQLAVKSQLSWTTIRNLETLRTHPENGTIERLLRVRELRLTLRDLPSEALPPEALPPEALPPEALPPEALPPEALPPEALPSETPLCHRRGEGIVAHPTKHRRSARRKRLV